MSKSLEKNNAIAILNNPAVFTPGQIKQAKEVLTRLGYTRNEINFYQHNTPSAQAVAVLLKNCLDFRAELTLEEASAVMHSFERYNAIPRKITDIFFDLQKEIGPCVLPDNPNNGSFINLNVWIGNERSLVIYVTSRVSARHGDTVEQHINKLKNLGYRYKAESYEAEEIKNTAFPSLKTVSARFYWG